MVLFISRRTDCGLWSFGGVTQPYDTALEEKGAETPIQHCPNRQEDWPLLYSSRLWKLKVSVADLEGKRKRMVIAPCPMVPYPFLSDSGTNDGRHQRKFCSHAEGLVWKGRLQGTFHYILGDFVRWLLAWSLRKVVCWSSQLSPSLGQGSVSCSHLCPQYPAQYLALKMGLAHTC